MKKSLAILLALIMTLAMVPAMAEIDPTETINIPVTKIWNDEGNESNRPQSITVKLMKGTDVVQTTTINKPENDTGTWTGSFTITPQRGTQYTVEEVIPAGYTVAYTQPMISDYMVTFGGIIEANNNQIVDLSNNLIIFKNPAYIWTKEVIPEADKADVVAKVKASASASGYNKLTANWNDNTPVGFIHGFGNNLDGKFNITANDETTTITVEWVNQSDKSLIGYGTLGLPEATAAVITNTYKKPEKETGSVTIKKAVQGLKDDELPESFTFQFHKGIEIIADVPVKKNGNNTYTPVTQSHLPVGEYTVVEQTRKAGVEGYDLTATSDKENNKVTVTNGGNVTIEFTNTYTKTEEPTGSLTITKKVEGLEDSEKPASFTFEIKQGETAKETVTVKKNANNTYDSVTVDNLPYGKYTVEEVGGGVQGYNHSTNFTGNKTTVTVSKETPDVTVNFTNKYEPIQPNTGTLIVKKTVSGGGADYNKAFTFTVTLEKEEVKPKSNQVNVMAFSSDPTTVTVNTYEVTYGDVTFEDGKATFTLKHNQEKIIIGIPAGTKYTVTENSDGYTVTKSGDTGTIKAGETATAAFNNYKAGGGSSHHHYPNPTPIPPIIVNPPKTGDMTIWQSILAFLGII